MEEERASEIYRHDEKRWKGANLDISQRQVDRRYWQRQARVNGSGPLGAARYLGEWERGRERESHAVSMDRKSGPLSSQPGVYSSRGSLETVQRDWYRLTRGERKVMRMGKRSGPRRRHLPDRGRRRRRRRRMLVRTMADKQQAISLLLWRQSKGTRGPLKRQAAHSIYLGT